MPKPSSVLCGPFLKSCRGGLFPAASNFVFWALRAIVFRQAAGNRPPLQRLLSVCLLLFSLPASDLISAEPPRRQRGAGSEDGSGKEPRTGSPEAKKAAEEGLKAFAKNDLEPARTAFRKLL